jgi:hypothetical protein
MMEGMGMEETALEISELGEGPERQAARRSDLYRLLAGAFAYPDRDLAEPSLATRDALAGPPGLPYPLIPGRSGLADAGPDATRSRRLHPARRGWRTPCASTGY